MRGFLHTLYKYNILKSIMYHVIRLKIHTPGVKKNIKSFFRTEWCFLVFMIRCYGYDGMTQTSNSTLKRLLI